MKIRIGCGSFGLVKHINQRMLTNRLIIGFPQNTMPSSLKEKTIFKDMLASI